MADTMIRRGGGVGVGSGVFCMSENTARRWYCVRLHEGGLWLVECGIASHRIVRSGVEWSGDHN